MLINAPIVRVLLEDHGLSFFDGLHLERACAHAFGAHVDAIFLERGPHIGDPCGAIFWQRRLAINTELIASQRHVPMFPPCRDLANLFVDASGVPPVHAIPDDLKAIDSVGN